ncbi:MAG: FmdB family zinc ribbon protein [Chitinispirillaceae bacterium]
MPIYEYKCRECGYVFEELMPLTASSTPPCPHCNSEETEKKMSIFGGIGGSGAVGGSCSSSGFT